MSEVEFIESKSETEIVEVFEKLKARKLEITA